MCLERIVANMRGVLRRRLKTHGSEAVGRFFDGLSRSRMIPHGKKATIGGMIVITVPLSVLVGRRTGDRGHCTAVERRYRDN